MASFWQRLFGGSAATNSTFETANPLASLQADMHSHLLPGLDDGAETVEDSLNLLRELRTLGFRKLIMTPHVMETFTRTLPRVFERPWLSCKRRQQRQAWRTWRWNAPLSTT